MKSIILKLSTLAIGLAIGLAAFALPVQSVAQTSNQQQIGQRFIIDRCRSIKAQIQQKAITTGQHRGTGYIDETIYYIENYLDSVGTPFAYQMLGDLQQAGRNSFNAWCSKYGI